MLSIETERYIAKFLLVLSEEELKIQKNKDELINNNNFNPYLCFTYISNGKDKIDNKDIYNFMNNNSINITLEESYLIILYFDTKLQNYWSFENFVVFLLNNHNMAKNEKRLNFSNSKGQITDIILKLLLNILNSELELIHKTLPLINQIKNKFDYNINNLYRALSFNMDNINIININDFLKRNGYHNISEIKLNSIINRLSLSKKNIISFSDLQRLIEVGYSEGEKSDLYVSMLNCLNNITIDSDKNKNEMNEDNNNNTYYLSDRFLLNSYKNNNSLNMKNDEKREIIYNNNYNKQNVLFNKENQEEKKNNSKSFHLNIIHYKNSEILEEKFFIDYLTYILGNEILIEKNKCKLALKYDFNIEDSIRIFKTKENKEKFISQNDFIYGTQFLDLNFDIEEIKLLFCRYDIMNNGYLTYNEFYEMILPFDKQYREIVEKRKSKGKINEMTLKCLKDLMQCICISEISIEKERNKLMKYLNDMSITKIFNKIDIDKKGFLSQKDLFNYLKSWNINIFYNNIDLLFNRLDRDKDGIINFNDIIIEISIVLSDEKINI